MVKFERIRGHSFVNTFDDNSIIIDLGACSGKFSSKFSKKYPYTNLLAVEANPNLIPKIKSNLNGRKNIEIINAIVDKESGNEKEFYINNKNLEASSIYKTFGKKNMIYKNHSLKDEDIVKVKTINLKDISSRYNKIDLLKVDIEGAEWDFFEKFSKEDYEKIDQITIEFHDFLNPSLRKRSEKVINKLKKLGYNSKIRGSIAWTHRAPYFDCLFYK